MRFLLTFFLLAILLPGSYALAAEHTFEISWAVDAAADPAPAGFRLYDAQLKKVCETGEPQATTMTCTVDVAATKATYTLVSYSANGMESEPSDPVTIVFTEPSPLKAIFHFTTENGSLAVNFDAAESTGQITRYNWQFGDGSSGTGKTIKHVFPAAGSYTVTLTIQDENGTTNSTQMPVTLDNTTGENQAPRAELVVTSSPMGNAPLNVTFDASGSSDPENSSLTYSWDFGDGMTATGEQQVTHLYTAAGTYTAKVTVSDSQGATNSAASQPILVMAGDGTNTGAMPQAAIATNSYMGTPPVQVTFSGAGSKPSQQNGTISQYLWDFGDGTQGTGMEVRHTFSESGRFTIQLTVTDNNGKQATASTVLTVSDTKKENLTALLLQVYKLLLLK